MAREPIGIRMTEHGYVDGPLFRLRYRLASGPIEITVWDGGFQQPNHTRLDCELRQGGKTIFKRGDTWCATPRCTDGNEAKELVTSLFAMHPSAGGGEGRDYYDSYTPEQLEWAEANGEELDMLRADRYCDETGRVK